jgi:N-acetylglucosaminyldiphosphoundecaprenol N-acetyl-beta-D-mannosaminyltransferase
MSILEQPPNGRADVLGCEIDRVDMEETLARCERFIRTRTRAQHMAVNAAKIVSSHNDEELHRLINGCEIVTADGQAVVWASRLLGDPLPTRVAGIDLMNELFALAERKGYRVFILGAKREVLDRALATLRERHPRLVVAGHRDGYYTAGEERAVVEQIRASCADLLFVAMSSPRKEYFLARWGATLDVPFSMGVGGAVDVLAGVTRRAPRRLQVLGLEWAFRLVQEPRRLFRRYLVTNFRFVTMTLRSARRRRRAAPASPRWHA